MAVAALGKTDAVGVPVGFCASGTGRPKSALKNIKESAVKGAFPFRSDFFERAKTAVRIYS